RPPSRLAGLFRRRESDRCVRSTHTTGQTPPPGTRVRSGCRSPLSPSDVVRRLLSIEVDVEGRHHPRHRIADRVAAAACEEQTDRAPHRVQGPNARTRVTAGAEIPADALDHELTGEPGPAGTVPDPP